MPMDIQAAVVEARGGPFRIRPLDLAEPGADEVLVRIQAAGICHTDLACRDQHLPLKLPHVFGHEGAGLVEACGSAVMGLHRGDRVVLSFASCGRCTPCGQGRPAQCWKAFALNYAGARPDGSSTLHHQGEPVHGCFFGQSSFATHALVHRSCVTVVDTSLPAEWLAPLGCGVQTGVGAVLNSLQCPAGSSLLIIGAGTVGLCALMAAKMAGCSRIVAGDRHPGRLALAEELGATHAVQADESLATAVKQLLKPGVDYALDCVGLEQTASLAFAALHPQGEMGLVGVPRPGASLNLPMHELLFGKKVRGIIEGDARPQDFIPRMLAWQQAGQLPYERLIRSYAFADIQQAVEDMEAGRVIKPVLRMD